jgi:phosphodiesterase/alkaline phosphatase D-like protein
MPASPAKEKAIVLGPCLGHLTETSVKIWLYFTPPGPPPESLELAVTIHPGLPSEPPLKAVPLPIQANQLSTGIAQITGLQAGHLYYYKIWRDANCTELLDLQGLQPNDLFFTTLDPSREAKRFDFLLISCNGPHTYPTAEKGYELWKRIPQILFENRSPDMASTRPDSNVRFALMVGDQVYADSVEGKVLKGKSRVARIDHYRKVYRKTWSNIHYRKVLCRLPSYLTWDDHDITDGWGSREDSFTDKRSSEFKPEWKGLFEAARNAFAHMQASRNPSPLSPAGFDTAFLMGGAAFVILDLRSNRNVRVPRIMSDQQWESLRRWITNHRRQFDTLFLVSSVVCSHGDPKLEQRIIKYWFHVLNLMKWLGRVPFVNRFAKAFQSAVGDLRDDINDSWGAEINNSEAEQLLELLFNVQNDGIKPKAQVIILSGDIHAAGYATVYSADEKHTKNAVIHHIASSPVAYKPFSWIGEAVYRRLTHAIKVGNSGKYSAHLSHHFCERNVAVVSLRRFPRDERQLKVKFYVENWPEPHNMIFDLTRSSHREQIAWAERLSAKQAKSVTQNAG